MGSVVVTGSGRNKYVLLVILILFLVAGGISIGFLLGKSTSTDDQLIDLLGEPKKIGRIDAASFNFTVANSAIERQRGLSGLAPLPPTDAMLFVFQSPGIECLWMKEMKFNIDIMWFDQYKKMIDIELNVSKDSYPQKFCPEKPAVYAVEVTAGVAEKNQLNVGDTLDIEL